MRTTGGSLWAEGKELGQMGGTEEPPETEQNGGSQRPPQGALNSTNSSDDSHFSDKESEIQRG